MYDSTSELLEKINLGEDSTIEFKRNLPQKGDLAAEIAAFANADGGVILIGVDDTGEIVGLDSRSLASVETMAVEICADTLEPMVRVRTEKLRIDEKNLLKIDVPSSMFVHKSTGRYFIRLGSSKRQMTTEQLGRLIQNRSQAHTFSFDEQFVPQTYRDTLRETLYQRFIREGSTRDEIEDLLRKRRLLVKEGTADRVSVAGILMCHDSPDEFLYNSFIQAVYYSGVEKDANYQIDAKDLKGPLDQQIVDAFHFVEKHNQISARKAIGRVDRPQYSKQSDF